MGRGMVVDDADGQTGHALLAVTRKEPKPVSVRNGRSNRVHVEDLVIRDPYCVQRRVIGELMLLIHEHQRVGGRTGPRTKSSTPASVYLGSPSMVLRNDSTTSSSLEVKPHHGGVRLYSAYGISGTRRSHARPQSTALLIRTRSFSLTHELPKFGEVEIDPTETLGT